jgi:hypothetical protein
MKSDLEKIFWYKTGEWVWCLHCERAYKVGEFRQVKDFQLCPYENCDGSPLDVWRWLEIAQLNNYHEEPCKDRVYHFVI